MKFKLELQRANRPVELLRVRLAEGSLQRRSIEIAAYAGSSHCQALIDADWPTEKVARPKDLLSYLCKLLYWGYEPVLVAAIALAREHRIALADSVSATELALVDRSIELVESWIECPDSSTQLLIHELTEQVTVSEIFDLLSILRVRQTVAWSESFLSESRSSYVCYFFESLVAYFEAKSIEVIVTEALVEHFLNTNRKQFKKRGQTKFNSELFSNLVLLGRPSYFLQALEQGEQSFSELVSSFDNFRLYHFDEQLQRLIDRERFELKRRILYLFAVYQGDREAVLRELDQGYFVDRQSVWIALQQESLSSFKLLLSESRLKIREFVNEFDARLDFLSPLLNAQEFELAERFWSAGCRRLDLSIAIKTGELLWVERALEMKSISSSSVIHACLSVGNQELTDFVLNNFDQFNLQDILIAWHFQGEEFLHRVLKNQSAPQRRNLLSRALLHGLGDSVFVSEFLGMGAEFLPEALFHAIDWYFDCGEIEELQYLIELGVAKHVDLDPRDPVEYYEQRFASIGEELDTEMREDKPQVLTLLGQFRKS